MELPHEIWVKVMIWCCVVAIAVILVLAVVQWHQQSKRMNDYNVLPIGDISRRNRGKPKAKHDITWLQYCDPGFSGVTVPLMEVTKVWRPTFKYVWYGKAKRSLRWTCINEFICWCIIEWESYTSMIWLPLYDPNHSMIRFKQIFIWEHLSACWPNILGILITFLYERTVGTTSAMIWNYIMWTFSIKSIMLLIKVYAIFWMKCKSVFCCEI